MTYGSGYDGSFYLLNGENSVLPNVDSLSDQDIISGYFENSHPILGDSEYCVFVGNNDKIYITGSPLIAFGDSILEKSWVLLSHGVASFYPDGMSYINSSGELFVSGEHSTYLGLNTETDVVVEDFKKVEGFGVGEKNGEAKKFVISGVNSYVLTENGDLYGTGLYTYNGKCSYPGWSDKVSKFVYTKILVDIVDFAINYSNDDLNLCRIAVASDGKVFGWGNNMGSLCLGNGSYVPKEVEDCGLSKVGIKKIEFMGDARCFVLTTEGKVFVVGNNTVNYYDGGFTGLKDTFVEYTNIKLDEGEKITDIAMNGTKTDLIVLTSRGRLFGYGTRSAIGKGQSTQYAEMGLLDTDSVNSISGGNGFFVAVKNDGTVWGTGDNTSGVLGRWSISGNSKIESRYQSAFQWVECKELEF